jgi:hypothetical protein
MWSVFNSIEEICTRRSLKLSESASESPKKTPNRKNVDDAPSDAESGGKKLGDAAGVNVVVKLWLKARMHGI